MTVEPALLTSTAALVGALIGGGASLAAAVYTQWHQDRLQHAAREAAKREAVYADFMMIASKVLVRAYLSERLTWTADEQHLIGLINRMRLFAPVQVIGEADEVIRTLIEISSQPRVDLHELARASLTDRTAPDLLLSFSLATQADLEKVTRARKPSTARLRQTWCFSLVSSAFFRLRRRVFRIHWPAEWIRITGRSVLR
jgi:uncharacterized membrane protein YebE (DUF533 family)